MAASVTVDASATFFGDLSWGRRDFALGDAGAKNARRANPLGLPVRAARRYSVADRGAAFAPLEIEMESRCPLPLLAVAALLVAMGAFGGCDPTPDFPPSVQPLIGTVMVERTVIVGTSGADADLQLVRVRLPGGAVAPGTELTMRLLADVAKTIPDATATTQSTLVLQILPPTAFSTDALAVFVLRDVYPGTAYGQLLHAAVADPAWETRARTTIQVSLAPPVEVQEPLTEGGLWMLAWQFGPPPAPDPIGPYVRRLLMCDGAMVVAAPMQVMTLDRGMYTWARATAASPTVCASVETGSYTLNRQTERVLFKPDDGTSAYGYDAYVNDGGFELKAPSANGIDCPVDAIVVMEFTAPNAVDGGVPDGCPTIGGPDAGAP